MRRRILATLTQPRQHLPERHLRAGHHQHFGDRARTPRHHHVLEAMKMEHVVMAGSAGAVAEMLVESGAQVALGQVLARLS